MVGRIGEVLVRGIGRLWELLGRLAVEHRAHEGAEHVAGTHTGRSVLTFAGSPNQTATAICGVMPQNVMSLYSVDVPVFAATTWPFGSAASWPVPRTC